MVRELLSQQAANSEREYFINPYNERIPTDYPTLINRLDAAVTRAQSWGLTWYHAANNREA